MHWCVLLKQSMSLILVTKPQHSWPMNSHPATPSTSLCHPHPHSTSVSVILLIRQTPSLNSPSQMWPSRVCWSLPGLTQRGPLEAFVRNLAAQQVAGQKPHAGSFEEKSTGAKFVATVRVYRGEKGRGQRGWTGGLGAD